MGWHNRAVLAEPRLGGAAAGVWGGVVCEWEGRPAQRVVWTAQQAPRACWRGYRCGWVGMGAMCEL